MFSARTRRLDLALIGPPLVASIASLFVLRATGVTVLVTPIAVLASVLAFFAILAVVYERRDRRLADVIRAAGFGVLLSNVFPLPMLALALLRRPLVDHRLASIDLAFGFDVSGIAARFVEHPGLAHLSTIVYASLLPFALLALLLPVLRHKAERAFSMLLAILLASFVSLSIFALYPAVGPWSVYEGMGATASQIETSRVFATIAAHGPMTLDLGDPPALVAMPSWHALLAILAARTLGWSRKLAFLPFAWGFAIAVSAITTGWHYGVDVVAGALLAELSWQSALALYPLLAPRAAA